MPTIVPGQRTGALAPIALSVGADGRSVWASDDYKLTRWGVDGRMMARVEVVGA